MFAQREETKLIATPYEVIWEEMAYEDIEDSSGWNSYILLILSIGMLYYKGDAIQIIDKSQVLKLTKHKC